MSIPLHRVTLRWAIVCVCCLSLLPFAQAEEEAAPEQRQLGAQDTPTSLPQILEAFETALGGEVVGKTEGRAAETGGITHKQWQGHRHFILQKMRTLLFAHDFVLVSVGDEETPRWRLLDIRRRIDPTSVGPADHVVLNALNLDRLATAHGRRIQIIVKVDQYAELAVLEDILDPQLSGKPWSSIRIDDELHGLVITDFAPRVIAAYRMVRDLENAVRTRLALEPWRTVRVLQLRGGHAREVATQLRRVFGVSQRETDADRHRTRPAPLRIEHYSVRNRLIVSGTPADVEAVADAVEALERKPEQPLETYVIPVPAEIASDVEEFVRDAARLWTDLEGRLLKRPIVRYVPGRQHVWVHGPRASRNRIEQVIETLVRLSGGK